MSANDTYDQGATGTAGSGADNDYVSRTGQSEIPVQSDDRAVEDPIDPQTADSDQQLEADDRQAIDKSNIIEGGRTRGAAKSSSTYQEPGDEEGLPGPDDGTSAIRQ